MTYLIIEKSNVEYMTIMSPGPKLDITLLFTLVINITRLYELINSICAGIIILIVAWGVLSSRSYDAFSVSTIVFHHIYKRGEPQNF